MNRIFCSTGTFIGRPNGRDYRLIPEYAKRFDVDAFELMLYSDWYEELPEIVSFLKDTGIPFPVLHAEKSIGHMITVGEGKTAMENFRANCNAASTLGSKKMVLHLWNGPSLDENIERNLHAAKELYRIAAGHGIELTVENVVVKQGSALAYLTRLYELCPEAHFTFDTKMAAFNAEMDAIYSPEHRWMWDEGIISHLHINDYAGGYMNWKSLRTLHIGKGEIDLDKFFGFIRQHYTGTMTLECLVLNQDGTYLFDEMNESIAILRAKTE